MAVKWKIQKFPISTDADLDYLAETLEAGEGVGYVVEKIVKDDGHIVVFARKET
jgi:hypothetical protein